MRGGGGGGGLFTRCCASLRLSLAAGSSATRENEKENWQRAIGYQAGVSGLCIIILDHCSNDQLLCFAELN